MNYLPETTVHVRIIKRCWRQGKIEGEVNAGAYKWQFQWCFTQGKLWIQPSLGRALIQEPLSRFLEHNDYQLELGSNYQFLLREEI